LPLTALLITNAVSVLVPFLRILPAQMQAWFPENDGATATAAADIWAHFLRVSF
jgi:hypothetical protein